MVVEFAESLLEAFERLLAPHPCTGGKDRGEYLQGIAELLALDAERVNLVVIPQFAVSRLEERLDEWLESAACKGFKTGVTPTPVHILKQAVHA
jgi:hypothetical protein